MIDRLMAELFAVSSHVRYVAVRQDGGVTMRERDHLAGASTPESDRYEELLVNPTLVTLLKQRGAIDCGGFEFVIIRYGNFFQLVYPVRTGHVSIALEPHSEPLALIPRLRAVVDRHFVE